MDKGVKELLTEQMNWQINLIVINRSDDLMGSILVTMEKTCELKGWIPKWTKELKSPIEAN